MTDLPQTFRYAVVSGLCLLLSTVSIPLLSWWGVHYAVATTIAFCVIAVIGFTLHSLWTFAGEFTIQAFIRYVSTIAINLPLVVILIAIAHDFVGLPVGIASVFASAVLVLWNFVAARWALQRRGVGAAR